MTKFCAECGDVQGRRHDHVRYQRELEGRCPECGAFNGPTHQCPQFTATPSNGGPR